MAQPSDPAFEFTPLMDGAASMHELYSAWVAVGFSDAQAIYLLGCMIAAHVNNDRDTPGGISGAGEPPTA